MDPLGSGVLPRRYRLDNREVLETLIVVDNRHSTKQRRHPRVCRRNYCRIINDFKCEKKSPLHTYLNTLLHFYLYMVGICFYISNLLSIFSYLICDGGGPMSILRNVFISEYLENVTYSFLNQTHCVA